MVNSIICEVITIICDIGTINVTFYLLEVLYSQKMCKYCTITHIKDSKKNTYNKINLKIILPKSKLKQSNTNWLLNIKHNLRWILNKSLT